MFIEPDHYNSRWAMLIFSLFNAISIPFIYDYIQQHRKLKRVKGFWREQLRLIERSNSRLDTREVLKDLMSIEGYVRATYNERN